MEDDLLKALAALGDTCAVDRALARPYLASAAEAQRAAELQANGVRASTAAVGQATTPAGVVILPVSGFIRPHASPLERALGVSFGASVERLMGRLREAVADESFSAVVMYFDTPGGSTYRLAQLHEEILNARAVKPVIAVVETLCASAGYWLASACTEIVAAKGATVGSIGVVGIHTSIKAALEEEGVKVTLISSTPEKVETYPENALSPEALAHVQSLIDADMKDFTAAIAKGRGLKASDVLEQYGRGRVYKAAEARRMGMVDRISTLDGVLAELAKRRPSSNARISRAARFAFDS